MLTRYLVVLLITTRLWSCSSGSLNSNSGIIQDSQLTQTSTLAPAPTQETPNSLPMSTQSTEKKLTVELCTVDIAEWGDDTLAEYIDKLDQYDVSLHGTEMDITWSTNSYTLLLFHNDQVPSEMRSGGLLQATFNTADHAETQLLYGSCAVIKVANGPTLKVWRQPYGEGIGARWHVKLIT